ncbi:hypothetical protein NDU88_001368 [Pleurodeles waltl]|uniref:Uncharacterized protein n=1 Tax=Pleurodeles waltl TaxID=8319 RepID=A0AAV7SCS4_PLEWA|nr:hypothetical protein NDU88_001368 [Pleurodeles waltl]
MGEETEKEDEEERPARSRKRATRSSGEAGRRREGEPKGHVHEENTWLVKSVPGYNINPDGPKAEEAEDPYATTPEGLVLRNTGVVGSNLGLQP